MVKLIRESIVELLEEFSVELLWSFSLEHLKNLAVEFQEEISVKLQGRFLVQILEELCYFRNACVNHSELIIGTPSIAYVDTSCPGKRWSAFLLCFMTCSSTEKYLANLSIWSPPFPQGEGDSDHAKFLSLPKNPCMQIFTKNGPAVSEFKRVTDRQKFIFMY